MSKNDAIDMAKGFNINGYTFFKVEDKYKKPFSSGVSINPNELLEAKITQTDREYISSLYRACEFVRIEDALKFVLLINEKIEQFGIKIVTKEQIDFYIEAYSVIVRGIKDSLCSMGKQTRETMDKNFETLYRAQYLSVDEEQHNNRKSVDGYVYILHSDSGYYKIGRAKNPANRLKTFNVKLPFMVHYDIVIPSSDYIRLEEKLHDRYEDKRVRGEWFALTQDDIAYLNAEFENVAEKYNE